MASREQQLVAQARGIIAELRALRAEIPEDIKPPVASNVTANRLSDEEWLTLSKVRRQDLRAAIDKVKALAYRRGRIASWVARSREKVA
jgi:hypothetical protein